MSVKLGYEAIEFAIRKFMAKNTKGIASIPGQAMKDKIKILVDKYADQFRIKGQDVNTVTVKQVDNAIDYGMSLKKQQIKKSKVISQGDPEFQGITEKLLGKKAKVHPLTGFKPRIQQDVDSIVKNLKSMEPVTAMKEANLVIGRKGNYKHLSNDEAQRILKETDDHIFQRDIKPDPEDLASGGLARVALGGGGAAWKIWQEFIEKLFIKSSNDIRLGKGKWKGLNQDQWIKQHDDLTKMLKKWEMSGKKRLPEGASEYLGMNDLQISKAIKDATKKVKKDVPEVSGIDDLLKSDFEAMTKPKKTLEGIKKEGTIDISDPKVADEFTTFLRESDPEKFKEFEQKIQLSDFDVKGKKGHASGGIAGQLHMNEGGRVPMIFGGSAGLKALIASIKAGLNKGRPEKIKTLFPKYSVKDREILKLGEKYLPKDSATLAAKEIEAKAEGIQVLIDRLKHDKKLIAEQAKNKVKKDPSLDFLMESLEKTMPEAYGPHLKKYTNIDKDILQLETIKKNLIMKDRKLNAEGGIAGQLHMNRQGYATKGFVEQDPDWGKTREEIIAESGFGGDGIPRDYPIEVGRVKAKPRASIIESEVTEPYKGYGPIIDKKTRETNIGTDIKLDIGKGIYGKGIYDKGRASEDIYYQGEKVMEDIPLDHDIWRYGIGYGDEGMRAEVVYNPKAERYDLKIVKSFGKGAKKMNQGGRVSYTNGGLAHVLGV